MRWRAPGRRRAISPWHTMQQANSPATKRATRHVAASSLIPCLVRYAMPTSAIGSRPIQSGLQ